MPKIKPGLVSVTFRKLRPDEIIKLCAGAGINAIEWGSDVHATDEAAAKKIAELSEENGIESVSLGSYYRAGGGEDFSRYIKIASALKTKNIRIWAGDKNSEDADGDYRAKIVSDAKAAADLAAGFGMDVSFEYHGNTLTNTQESAVRLLGEIGRENVYTYWQPLGETTHDENINNVKELCALGKLKNMHVYYWDGGARLPLKEGADKWAGYFAAAEGFNGSALLEFVINDGAAEFISDAAVLKKLTGAGG